MTPFQAGQAAFKAGLDISTNKHKPVMEYGDAYPGKWRNWRDGWIHAQGVAWHKERANT